MYSYCTKCDNPYCQEHAAIVNKRYDCCISCDDKEDVEDREPNRAIERKRIVLK